MVLGANLLFTNMLLLSWVEYMYITYLAKIVSPFYWHNNNKAQGAGIALEP